MKRSSWPLRTQRARCCQTAIAQARCVQSFLYVLKLYIAVQKCCTLADPVLACQKLVESACTHARLQDLYKLLEELQKRGVLLLVTTRNLLPGTLGGCEVKMPPLGDTAGEELLRSQAGANVQWEGAQASQLVQLSGGNPLIITVLAGFLHTERCTPTVCF